MANKVPGILRNLRIKRVSLVDMGANFDTNTGDGAHIMLFKRADINKDGPSLGSVHVDSPDWDNDDADEYEKADLTSSGRRSLPDSAFAAVWTDAQGKKHRKLPIQDAGHLAAARGRLEQAQLPADVKAAARHKIEAASKNKEKNVKKSILSKILGLVTETDAEKRAATAKEVEKDIEGLEKSDHDADDDMCKCADCTAKAVKRATPEEAAAITKRLDDVEKAHAAERTELQKRLDAAEGQVRIEKEARLNGEMLTLLKGFKATPFDVDMAKADNDVTKFRKMKETDPALFERTMTLFKAADAQMAAGGSFRKYGSDRAGGSEGDAWAQIEAKAAAMLEKSGTGLTKEQAIEKVCLENPKLAEQYREQQQ